MTDTVDGFPPSQHMGVPATPVGCIEGEENAVVLGPMPARPVLVDRVDWVIFSVCDDQVTVGELVEDVVDVFEVSEDEALQRVKVSRQRLHHAGLLAEPDIEIPDPLRLWLDPPNN